MLIACATINRKLNKQKTFQEETFETRCIFSYNQLLCESRSNLDFLSLNKRNQSTFSRAYYNKLIELLTHIHYAHEYREKMGRGHSARLSFVPYHKMDLADAT